MGPKLLRNFNLSACFHHKLFHPSVKSIAALQQPQAPHRCSAMVTNANRAVRSRSHQRSVVNSDAPLVLSNQTLIYEYDILVAGALSRRYKRFLADVDMTPRAQATSPSPSVHDQESVETSSSFTVVHCPNTGPMTGLLDVPMAAVRCSVSANAARKYAQTLVRDGLSCCKAEFCYRK